jgi:hypothetical protein
VIALSELRIAAALALADEDHRLGCAIDVDPSYPWKDGRRVSLFHSAIIFGHLDLAAILVASLGALPRCMLDVAEFWKKVVKLAQTPSMHFEQGQ